MVLLSTHNICFSWKVMKLILYYTLLNKGLKCLQRGPLQSFKCTPILCLSMCPFCVNCFWQMSNWYGFSQAWTSLYTVKACWAENVFKGGTIQSFKCTQILCRSMCPFCVSCFWQMSNWYGFSQAWTSLYTIKACWAENVFKGGTIQSFKCTQILCLSMCPF